MATESASPDALAGAPARRTRTIAALWRARLAAPPTTPAYLVETESGWQEVSWAEAARRVDDLANGLLALGVQKGEAVGIVGRTRLEWALVDFAIALVGAVAAPVYPNSSDAETGYILDHSESVIVFVEDDGQRKKVERVRAPRVEHVIGFDELGELEERGRRLAAERPEALAKASAAIDEDDLFTYIYTSGTTGPPKGCMIRHRNYYEMADAIRRVDEFLVHDDVVLLYLPLAHNFGRLLHLLGPHLGFTIALLPDPLRVGDVLGDVRPTILPSVPRVFEKVHTAVRGQFDAATGVKGRLVRWALAVGRRASEHGQRGEPVPRPLAAQHALADRLVYAKVKDRLGGRLRLGVSGGAPLAKEIAEFFHSLDVLVLEGYGETECTTACSVNLPHRFRFGTVGPALPGFELRVDDDGEILVRSETVFAGYLKDDAATREVLGDDGWLRTGDIGELDADGFLTITDRKKDIIVTAGGKNVAPQNVENALKTAPLVSQALVVGDRRPYVVALITLDPGAAESWAAEHGEPADPAALAASPQLRAHVQRIVDDVNAGLSRHEQIKRFAVLPRDFSAEHDEVTPTLKLKRRRVQEHFAAEIESLYAAG